MNCAGLIKRAEFNKTPSVIRPEHVLAEALVSHRRREAVMCRGKIRKHQRTFDEHEAHPGFEIGLDLPKKPVDKCSKGKLP